MGGKAPATTTSTTKQDLSPEQQEALNLVMPFVRDWAKSPMPQYSGNTVAGFTPEQIQAQERYKAQVGTVDDLAARSAASQKFMLSTDQLDHTKNPYIKGVADQISGDIRTNLLEKALPVVRGGAITAGGMYGGGSTRQGLAEGKAITGAAEETGDALEKLYFNNYQAGLNNIARAQQLNPTVQAQQLFGANVLEAVGGQKQAMEQALMNQDLQKWISSTYAPYFRSQELLQMLGMMPSNGAVTSTATGVTPKANPVTGALGGAATGAAIGSVIPGIGTAIGALGGGLAGLGGSFL